jgi:hypothetical protein
VPVRINAGGSAYTDTSGNKWLADVDYTGGSADDQAKGQTIAGTNDGALYQDERWGTFSYHLPVVNGTYTLKLHFAEIYAGCAKTGCRVFNVNVNGKPWLTNFDIAAKVGANKADVEETTVTVTQNALDLSFTGVTGSPQIAALELVTPVVATPTPPAPQPNTTFTAIKGIASKCIDNRYNTKANGNKIQLYTCNGSDAQKWALQSSGAIKNINGYCLDAQSSGTKPGTLVQLYQCNGTDAQIWKVNTTNHTIVNPHANLCLDDYSSRTGNGTQIQLWTCNGTDAQKWDFTN